MATAAAARRYPEAPSVVERWHGHRPRRRPLPAAVRRSLADRPTTRRSGSSPPTSSATDDGSGIVHIAPAFGEDDAAGRPGRGPAGAQPGRRRRHLRPRRCRAYTGALREGRRPRRSSTTSPPAACSCAEEPYEHSYPHCWRCDTPLIYWAKTSWFARTSERRAELLARERAHRLAPRAHQARPLRQVARGQRRLGAVARPLLGHAAADLALRRRPRHLRRLGGRAVRARRPRPQPSSTCTAPTSTTSRSPARATAARRPPAGSPPVLDAWFDSGSMPSAQHHYPFDGRRRRSPTAFPADFICEAIDQTRGWFYSLLAVNTLVFDSTPYRERRVPRPHRRRRRRQDVEVHAATSSTRGRSSTSSAPTRCAGTSSPPASRGRRGGSPRTASASRPARRCSRSGTCFSFLATYADLDGWTPDGPTARRPRTCSTGGCSASSTTRSPRSPTALEGFDALGGVDPPRPASSTTSPTGTCAARRPRFWKSSDPAAHATLHQLPRRPRRSCWRRSARSSPTSSTRRLTGERVGAPGRLADAPAGRADADGLGRRWPRARRLVALGRAARTDAKVKVRQPLRRALLLHPGVDARRRACAPRSPTSST